MIFYKIKNPFCKIMLIPQNVEKPKEKKKIRIKKRMREREREREREVITYCPHKNRNLISNDKIRKPAFCFPYGNK